MSDVEILALKLAPTIYGALAAKYCLPHHILLWEVRNSTGFDSTNAADALAITLYVSRGRAITGFEIKKSRSDWLAELKRPEKAEAIAKFCDFFFLLTPVDTIIKPTEIPHPWGWLCLRGERLKVMKKADRLDPIPLDRAMLCSLLQRVQQKYYAEGKMALEETVAERLKEIPAGWKYTADREKERADHLDSLIDSFEKASDLHIRYGSADIPKIGDAVRTLMKGTNVFEKYKSDLEWVLGRAKRVVTELEQELQNCPPSKLSDTSTAGEKSAEV